MPQCENRLCGTTGQRDGRLSSVGRTQSILPQSLITVLVISVTLRVAAAVYQGNSVQALPGVHDQLSYDALARRVAQGYGFTFASDWWPATSAGQVTAHWSFAYTLYLAAIYAFVGPYPVVGRVIQAVVAGILHPYLTWRIGSRLFGPRAGVIASLIAAAYGYFVFYAGALMAETFYILAILWVFDIAIHIKMQEQVPQRTRFLILGFALGITVLLRQAFLLFVPFLLIWLGAARIDASMRRPHGRAIWTGVLTAAALMGLLILPWTVRNYLVFQRFVLLNTNAGFAFFWANHPVHGNQFIPVLPDGKMYRELIPAGLSKLDEARLDQALLTEGLREVRRDPVRYARLSMSRSKEYFKFWPSASSGLASNVVRVLSFGLLLPVAVVGLCVALFGRRVSVVPDGEESGSSEVFRAGRGVLYLFICVYSLIHLLSWALIRYRLPVDAVLVVFASAGIQWIWRRASILPSKPARIPIRSR